MPQKIFYVSEEDKGVIEEIEEIIREGHVKESSLSSIIINALRRYIQDAKNKQRGMKEEQLEVGDKNDQNSIKKIIFTGKKLAFLDAISREKQVQYSIYQSSKNHYLLYIIEQSKERDYWKSWHILYSSLEEVVNVPDELIVEAKENLEDDKIIYLYI